MDNKSFNAIPSIKHCTVDGAIDRIEVLRLQEDGVYAIKNVTTSFKDIFIWREKMCDWTYQVVDYYKFDREIVAVALSILDRFSMKRNFSKKDFQLASMTSLHLAVKLYEHRELRMLTLTELSRGLFSLEDMVNMEKNMLKELDWMVHPPTSVCFIRQMFIFLPSSVSERVKKVIFELSRFLTELSVCENSFMEFQPSTIAFASILNAIQLVGKECFSIKSREDFLYHIEFAIKKSCVDSDVVKSMAMLEEVFSKSPGYAVHEASLKSVENEQHRSEVRQDTHFSSNSPVSVVRKFSDGICR